jgi:hypothetical protein
MPELQVMYHSTCLPAAERAGRHLGAGAPRRRLSDADGGLDQHNAPTIMIAARGADLIRRAARAAAPALMAHRLTAAAGEAHSAAIRLQFRCKFPCNSPAFPLVNTAADGTSQSTKPLIYNLGESGERFLDAPGGKFFPCLQGNSRQPRPTARGTS